MRGIPKIMRAGNASPHAAERMSLVLSYARLFALVIVVSAMIIGPACKIIPDKVPDEIANVRTATENALDDAIDRLATESANWQTVLQDLENQLTADAQSTVRNEVANVASRSIAEAGAEFRCNADFIGDQVKHALIRIKAKFLDKPVPPVKPALCQVVPIAVDRQAVPTHVTQLEFYGYDFDHANNLKVFLDRTTGGRLDVGSYLARPTHYAMTLPFGATGVQLDNTSKRFVLEWEGSEISTVAVIQPTTPVCETKIDRFRPGGITYVPPHTKGDRDFDGNGPKITASVSLEVAPQMLRAKVYMRAKETKSDWTTAEGTEYFDLFTPDPGWQINSVVGNQSNSHQYRDSNHTNDSFDLGSGGPAGRFVFVGDTDGKEAGTRTKIDITFNELRIELTQTANCVPDNTISMLRAVGKLSDSAWNRLEAAVRTQRARRGLPAIAH